MAELFRVFVHYLRKNLRLLLLTVLLAGIFTGIFYLYDVELEAIIHAAGLCLMAVSIVVAADFIGFYRKHIRLQRMLREVHLEEQQFWPCQDLIEEDYQRIVQRLWEFCREESSRYGIWRADSIDYYTTWVHQIKSPITAMRLQLQKEDSPGSRQLLSELFRIEQYVEMALCYVRLDSTSTDFVFREYDLDELIKKSVRKYASQFIGKHLSLIYQGTDKKVLTDEKWLMFILEQILSNAIKYTDAGSVKILVEGDCLTVEDTGIGIASEDLPRIFEKGFTGYNGRADKKSTGLGLYLSKKTADQLGHQITVQSEVGRGSRFQIHMKRKKQDIF